MVMIRTVVKPLSKAEEFDKLVNEITASVNEDNIDLQCTVSPENQLVAFIKLWETGFDTDKREEDIPA